MSSAFTTRPIRTLSLAFGMWKLFLLVIAAGASLTGEAYDTSAGLSLGLEPDAAEGWGAVLVSRLASWDAAYFVAQARRGYLFEQEWAFGAGLPTAISWLIRVLQVGGLANYADDSRHRLLLEPIAGIFLAHVSHYLSAIVLYHLSRVVWRDDKLSLVAALLHVFSPAGIFLSAPNAESGFALLSFVGHLLFARSCSSATDVVGTSGEKDVKTGQHQSSRTSSSLLVQDACILGSGVVFGLATTFRSNGLLNGVPFAWEFLWTAARTLPQDPARGLRRLSVLGLGGVCVAAGSVLPQTVAYGTFCSGGSDLRPWCRNFPPGIYTFVQKRYWNVGFLKYWTTSNLPLFLLAGPMLYVLLRSGLAFLPRGSAYLVNLRDHSSTSLVHFVQCLAGAQALLATLTLTCYHVQIVTRLSSGYPVWYWWLASHIIHGKQAALGKGIVMFMVMYASVQGALFASFLPPA